MLNKKKHEIYRHNKIRQPKFNKLMNVIIIKPQKDPKIVHIKLKWA